MESQYLNDNEIEQMTTFDPKIIAWSDRFKIGFSMVDQHHKKLFHIAKKLQKSIVSKFTTPEKIKKIAVELRNYSVYHFATEEEIMQSYGCPYYEKQKKEHSTFIRTIENAFPDLIHGDLSAREKVYSFLINWLVVHVINSDKQWADWIRANSPEAIR